MYLKKSNSHSNNSFGDDDNNNNTNNNNSIWGNRTDGRRTALYYQEKTVVPHCRFFSLPCGPPWPYKFTKRRSVLEGSYTIYLSLIQAGSGTGNIANFSDHHITPIRIQLEKQQICLKSTFILLRVLEHQLVHSKDRYPR